MADFHHVLAIETSCDDTSVAVVRRDGFVLTCLSADQNAAHTPFGGVVPEIASRNHTMTILPLVERVLADSNLNWSQIDGVAVTSRPGLIGSLLVGVITAKTLAQAKGKPLIGVNHLEGHILAPFLKDDRHQPPAAFGYPFVSLAVSGGHTTLYWVEALHQYKVLGTTRDDAAGEAFDKFGQMLGLGFPGGVKVDQLAQKGDSQKYHFPRSYLEEGSLEFSFSGMKSSAARLLQSLTEEELDEQRPHLCAGFQESVVDVLMQKLDTAVSLIAQNCPVKSVSITGGVSANSRLRKRAEDWARSRGVVLAVPPLRYCTDNAAMIGYAGILRLLAGEEDSLALAPSPTPLVSDFLPGVGWTL